MASSQHRLCTATSTSTFSVPACASGLYQSTTAGWGVSRTIGCPDAGMRGALSAGLPSQLRRRSPTTRRKSGSAASCWTILRKTFVQALSRVLRLLATSGPFLGEVPREAGELGPEGDPALGGDAGW